MGQNLSAKIFSPSTNVDVGDEKSLTTGETLLLSATAGMFAEIATYPLDLLKTRQQAFLTLDKPKNAISSPLAINWKNFGGMAVDIIRREGALKLWDGLTPALTRQFVATGLRTTIYEKLRDNVFGKEKDKKFPLGHAIICSVLAGSLSQLIISPTDLIKILLQTEGQRRLLGKKPRAKGIFQTVSMVVKREGFRGLWRGGIVNMNVAVLTSVAGFTTYDECKQVCLLYATLPDNYKTHVLCSLITSYVTTLAITPMDVVKTRIMNQSVGKDGTRRYKSALQCFMTVAKQEGFLALYSGFWPSFLRLAPWYLLFWVAYEQARRLSGKNTF